MKIPFFRPDIREEDVQAVAEVLRSGWITTGVQTQAFERELADLCGTERAVCTGSQTAAAELTLRLLGIGEGDEVLLPAYTYTATCSVVCHVGAAPVLVDCAADSFEMDYRQLEEAITPRTKCIIPVDIGGRMCDYPRILEIVRAKAALFQPSSPLREAMGRVAVVAGAAHALGAQSRGKRCGQAADFTAFSFHAVKNLTTAEGGAVTWLPIAGVEDEWLCRQYRLLSLHGQDRDALAKTRAGGWEYDVLFPGYKCNMTDLQAALGRSQLTRYPAMLEKRQRLASRYSKELSGLPLLPMSHRGADFISSGHLALCELPAGWQGRRDRLMDRLAEAGVVCNVHYKPLPWLTAYRRMGFRPEDFPRAAEHYRREITLPLFTALTEAETDFLLCTVRRILADELQK